jgi:hypothetical protein
MPWWTYSRGAPRKQPLKYVWDVTYAKRRKGNWSVILHLHYICPYLIFDTHDFLLSVFCIVPIDCLFFRRLKINHDSHEFILEIGTVANTWNRHTEWTYSMDKLHGHEVCSMDTRHGHASTTCSKDLKKGHAARTCSMDMSIYVHVQGMYIRVQWFWKLNHPNPKMKNIGSIQHEFNNHLFYFCVFVSAFVFKSIFKNNFLAIKIATFLNVVFSFPALKLMYFTIPSK